MKTKIFKKPLSLIFVIIILIGCNSEEELPPNKLIGEWEVYSITDEEGETIVWDDLTNSLIELIPEYACMEFTATATEQIVSTRYVFVDVNSRGCLSPAISVYTWQVSPETGFYEFTQGTNVINYLVSFSNNDNRMTWNDQTSGAITVWNRIVTTTTETTE
tara:strand:+ start:24675 stop:25157 length:483 start_codon:yes stop_codon:yes gene_type:complete